MVDHLSRASPTQMTYRLDIRVLTSAKSHCDLWIINSNGSHIVSKAYKMLGLNRNTFDNTFGSSNVRTRKLLLITLVRSQLTYCAVVWRPHILNNIVINVTVQKVPPNGSWRTTPLIAKVNW